MVKLRFYYESLRCVKFPNSALRIIVHGLLYFPLDYALNMGVTRRRPRIWIQLAFFLLIILCLNYQKNGYNYHKDKESEVTAALESISHQRNLSSATWLWPICSSSYLDGYILLRLSGSNAMMIISTFRNSKRVG